MLTWKYLSKDVFFFSIRKVYLHIHKLKQFQSESVILCISLANMKTISTHREAGRSRERKQIRIYLNLKEGAIPAKAISNNKFNFLSMI